MPTDTLAGWYQGQSANPLAAALTAALQAEAVLIVLPQTQNQKQKSKKSKKKQKKKKNKKNHQKKNKKKHVLNDSGVVAYVALTTKPPVLDVLRARPLSHRCLERTTLPLKNSLSQESINGLTRLGLFLISHHIPLHSVAALPKWESLSKMPQQ